MKTTVSIGQAKPRLCDLVEQARKGQTHIITVRDQPCAQLGPIPSTSRKLTDQWRVRREGIRLNRSGQKKLSITQLIQETRK